MTDAEKLMAYAKYMRDKNYDENRVNYNLLVVRLLVNRVLSIFRQSLENIDTYSFEEFTDMATLIDDQLGGREGIPRMLEAMQDLTEFLKVNKLIKGGKIAHYKRMFSNVDYYLDKYDMITGRKDDTKEFIKTITTNRFSSSLLRVLEDVNVYEIKTIEKMDKLLNDVPLGNRESKEETSIIKNILMKLSLLEMKNEQIEITKKGRAISRLSMEEKYAAIIYSMLYNLDWKNVFEDNDITDSSIEFNVIRDIMASVFHKKKEVAINGNDLKNLNEEDILVEIANDRFRIARIETVPFGFRVMDIFFVGMGLIEINPGEPGEIIYSATPLGENVFKLMYTESCWWMKNSLDIIKYVIKDKKYDEAEIKILEFLSTYGGNIVVWDYLGQLLLLKKNYKYAYNVLKNAYETSSKRGKAARSALYHLVLCCRKLKLEEDVKNYELQLQRIEKTL